MAAAGREISPDILWYTDDRCLSRSFDLVMVNGSLQYIREWRELLPRLAASTQRLLLLTRVPVVTRSAGFVAVQQAYGQRLLHQQFNRGELLGVIADAGLVPVREFVVDDRLYVRGAPEQCEMAGWLFRPQGVR